MEQAEKPKLTKWVELPENEMVAIVIRAFFEVPEDTPADEVIAHTDPEFVNCARCAVRDLMLWWAQRIRDMGMTPAQTEAAVDKVGLAAVDKPEALS